MGRKRLMIVDPYLHLEVEDNKRFPWHEKECQEFVLNKIIPLCKKFENIYVATWDDREVHPSLVKYDRIFKISDIKDLGSDDKLYYCGFHYGRCILNMPVGIMAMKKKGYSCFLLDSYSCVFPADDIELVRHKTEKYSVKIMFGRFCE